MSHTTAVTLPGVAMSGAAPVLVDIDPDRCTKDPTRLEGVRSASRVAAVVVVHVYDQPADLDAIVDLGDTSACSFYPTRKLVAFGDGGQVATGDARIASRLRTLRQYGWCAARISREPGVDSRLEALQAAVPSVRLADLDVDDARRDRRSVRRAAPGIGSPACRSRACGPIRRCGAGVPPVRGVCSRSGRDAR